MTSKPVAFLLADLGVKTHSRPHVSNDNPYSESQFKTMKYRPEFPSRFGSSEDAREFCRAFFLWYNTRTGTPGSACSHQRHVHYGQGPAITKRRADVLEAAFIAKPEPFVRGIPRPPAEPLAAWTNSPPHGRGATAIVPGIVIVPGSFLDELFGPSNDPPGTIDPDGTVVSAVSN
jgi:putative transposase